MKDIDTSHEFTRAEQSGSTSTPDYTTPIVDDSNIVQISRLRARVQTRAKFLRAVEQDVFYAKLQHKRASQIRLAEAVLEHCDEALRANKKALSLALDLIDSLGD